MGGFKSERAVLRAWIDLPESSPTVGLGEVRGVDLDVDEKTTQSCSELECARRGRSGPKG